MLKKTLSVLMAVLMIAAVTTVSAFATAPGWYVDGTYFYVEDGDSYSPTMGSAAVVPGSIVYADGEYTFNMKLMDYGTVFKGYIDVIAINGTPNILTKTPEFQTYLNDNPYEVGTKAYGEYVMAYDDITHTALIEADPYDPIHIVSLNLVIYNKNTGLPFNHPPITTAYIALPEIAE
ncbi:MAG: hypothetical protein LBP73_11215 [Clostridiales Family XIII bacterium]|jgi:hypothetical protein|nr:hypothetical protein [Clostridiales Family XIII bacterium]